MRSASANLRFESACLNRLIPCQEIIKVGIGMMLGSRPFCARRRFCVSGSRGGNYHSSEHVYYREW